MRVQDASFRSFDGTRLSYRAAGEGRPLVLRLGFLVDSEVNWVDPDLFPWVARSAVGPPQGRAIRVPGDHVGAIWTAEFKETLLRFARDTADA